MNEPNQMEPWAVAIVEKHRTAMLNELKREYVQRNLVDPLVRQVMADLDRIAAVGGPSIHAANAKVNESQR